MTNRKTATTMPVVCALVPLPELRQRQSGNRRAITHTQPAVLDRAAVSVRGRNKSGAPAAAAPGKADARPTPAAERLRMPRYRPDPEPYARAGAFDFLRCPSRGIG